jgi:hypothetical protein
MVHVVQWRVKPFLKAHFPLLVAFKRALRWPRMRAGNALSAGTDQ